MPMVEPRNSHEGTNVTGMTDASEANGMTDALHAMQSLMQGKRQKKNARVSELHTQLIEKVSRSLQDVASNAEGARSKHSHDFKERLAEITEGGAVLEDIVNKIDEKLKEMEECSASLDAISESQETLSRKRTAFELEHREDSIKRFRALKQDTEEVLFGCMKGLQKVCPNALLTVGGRDWSFVLGSVPGIVYLWYYVDVYVS